MCFNSALAARSSRSRGTREADEPRACAGFATAAVAEAPAGAGGGPAATGAAAAALAGRILLWQQNRGLVARPPDAAACARRLVRLYLYRAARGSVAAREHTAFQMTRRSGNAIRLHALLLRLPAHT